jgi:RimJ/RimL family protein N-acetyltransferase
MLYGKHIYLDAVREDDLPTSARWMADFEVTYHLWTTAVVPLSLEDEQEWFENRDQSSETTFTFYLRTIRDGQLIGLVSLIRYDMHNQIASLGIAIGERDEQNKGYGTEAMRLALNYGFNELNLHRIELTVSSFNPHAIHIYEKLGFQHEGIKRQALFRDGRYHDVIQMGILRNEWQSFR